MSKVTGWLFTDAKNFVDCPRCGVVAGEDCRRPSGGKAWPPHAERTEKLITDKPDIAIMSYRGTGNPFDDNS